MPRGGRANRDPSGVPGTERLLALTDGVVAIALTLLVLQVHVPSLPHDTTSPSKLADAFGNVGAELSSYFVSFYVIAEYWLAHHRVFRLISGHDEVIAWWNFGFLFTITLFPFSSALLAAFPDNSLAVVEFAANLLLANVAASTTVLVARHRKLLLPAATPELVRRSRLRGMAASAVILASIVVAFPWPSYAKLAWPLLAVAPGAAERWARRHPLAADGTPPTGAPPERDPPEGRPGGPSRAD